MIGFNNVSLLDYALNNKYLGESSYFFAAEKTLNIKGFLYDFSCTSGIGGGIISGINALNLVSNSSLDEIIINNKSFGSGYVKNITVDAGNWVRSANYTAELLILETGNLYNMIDSGVSGYYISGSNIDWQNNLLNKIKYVTDLSLNTEIKKENDSKVYEIIDTIDISLDPSFVLNSGNIYAREIKNLFSRKYSDIKRDIDIFSGFEYGVREYSTENLDDINKSYSFKRNFSFVPGDPTGIGLNYFEFSVSLEENGTVRASEKSRKPKTSNQTDSELYAWFRNGSLFDKQKLNEQLQKYGLSGDSMVLIEKNITETDEYYERAISYSNEDAGSYFGSVEKSRKFRVGDDGYPILDTSVSIEGYGEPGSAYKWNAALSGFEMEIDYVKSGNQDLNNYILDNEIKFCTVNGLNPYMDSYSIAASKYNGKIVYSATWGTKPITTGDGGEYTEYTVVKNEEPRIEYKDYVIYQNNGAGIVKVPFPQTSLGIKTITKTRKYNIDKPFYEVVAPEIQLENEEFVTSKKIRLSENSSELEIVQNYHE